MEVNKYIAKENFNLWYEIFKHSGGRFLSDPIEWPNSVYVNYYFDDVQEEINLNHSFQSLTKPVVETRQRFIKRIKRRFLRLIK